MLVAIVEAQDDQASIAAPRAAREEGFLWRRGRPLDSRPAVKQACNASAARRDKEKHARTKAETTLTQHAQGKLYVPQ